MVLSVSISLRERYRFWSSKIGILGDNCVCGAYNVSTCANRASDVSFSKGNVLRSRNNVLTNRVHHYSLLFISFPHHHPIFLSCQKTAKKFKKIDFSKKYFVFHIVIRISSRECKGCFWTPGSVGIVIRKSLSHWCCHAPLCTRCSLQNAPGGISKIQLFLSERVRNT